MWQQTGVEKFISTDKYTTPQFGNRDSNMLDTTGSDRQFKMIIFEPILKRAPFSETPVPTYKVGYRLNTFHHEQV